MKSLALFIAALLIVSSGFALIPRSSIISSYTCPSGSPCGPSDPSQLIDESIAEPYDYLDPSQGFFIADGYFASVFQGLVAFNPYNSSEVVPALASSWTVSAGPLYSGSPNFYTQWNFRMRQNTWFSDGNPINAYVAWFSFVRILYMNSPTKVGLTNYASITLNLTNPLDVTPDGNVFPDGLQNALSYAGLCAVNPNNDQGCVSALNSMLSNFNWNNATQLKVMSYPDQAYVASSNSSFTINTIQPYSQTLLILPSQWGAMVDPQFIDSSLDCGSNPCGGVQNNTQPTYIAQNGMPGSGPYEYGPHGSGNTELILTNNTRYWADGVSGLAPNLQPAKIGSIVMKFGSPDNTSISDFVSSNAEIISPSQNEFSTLWSSYHSAYPGVSFNSIFETQGYSPCEFYVSMNMQYTNYSLFGYSPVNYTNVRQALVHAVNYTEILDKLYSTANPSNGSLLTLGELFLPPIPPGFGPLDNPQNIALYPYNITLARDLIASAGIADGFYVKLPNGTSLGDTSGNLFDSIDFAFIAPEGSYVQGLISILNQGLDQIGVNVNPEGLSFNQFVADESLPTTTPPMSGAAPVGWCADWADPIYQFFYDLGTQAAGQPSWVDNATLTNLLGKIPFEPYLGLQIQQTEEAYNIFTQLATMIQLPDGVVSYFVQPYVQNVTYSPFQYAIYYDMISYSSSTSNSGNSHPNQLSLLIPYLAIGVAVVAVIGGSVLAIRRREKRKNLGMLASPMPKVSIAGALGKLQETRRLAAIMFTDMVGFTNLNQTNEAQALKVLERHNQLLRPLFLKYHGREVKTIGDSFLVEFDSALDATNCAIDIQKSLYQYNLSTSEDWKIRLRIGIHVGDVVHKNNDIFGDAVNIASRIEPLAEPEGVCISQQVFDQIHNKIEYPLKRLDKAELKDVKFPTNVYSIDISSKK